MQDAATVEHDPEGVAFECRLSGVQRYNFSEGQISRVFQQLTTSKYLTFKFAMLQLAFTTPGGSLVGFTGGSIFSEFISVVPCTPANCPATEAVQLTVFVQDVDVITGSVGTVAPVPEPSTWAMMISASAVSASSRIVGETLCA